MRSLATTLLAVLMLFGADAAAAQTEVTARGAEIRLGGRLHTQFATSSVDGQPSTFFFRRARLIADVSVNELWSARVQTEFSGGRGRLVDAWVRYNFAPGFRVSVGQFKRRFDIFELESSTELPIIERDGRISGVDSCAGVGRVCTYGRFVSSLAYGGRDAGVRVEAGTGALRFSGSVTNGSGANTADTNTGKAFDARLDWAAGESLSVGGGIARHDYEAGDETEYGTAWSVDATWGTFRDGLHVQAALLGGDNWKLSPDATFMAWQVVGSFYKPLEGRLAGVEPLFRISAGDPDTSVDSDGGLVYTPGLMFYVAGRNMFGVNLDVYSPQTGDTEYGLKTQFFLYF